MTSAEGGAMGLPKKEDKIREVAYCRSVLNVDKEGGGGGSQKSNTFVDAIQRSAKRYANLTKQDPGRARQNS